MHEKKSPVEREKVKTVDAKEQSFWILLESALDDILTPAETSAFISKMKKVGVDLLTIMYRVRPRKITSCNVLSFCIHTTLFWQGMSEVPGSLNLEDLNAAASTIV